MDILRALGCGTEFLILLVVLCVECHICCSSSFFPCCVFIPSFFLGVSATAWVRSVDISPTGPVWPAEDHIQPTLALYPGVSTTNSCSQLLSCEMMPWQKWHYRKNPIIMAGNLSAAPLLLRCHY